jgi:effector-binding domain-containing protein
MDVDISTEPGRHLAATRFDADLAHMDEQMGAAFAAVAAYLGREGVTTPGPALAHYDVRPDGMTVSAGFVVSHPVDGDGTVVDVQLPECEVVSGVHVGPYDELPTAYEQLRDAAEARGRKLDESAMWEEYVTGPEVPPEQMRTVVSWPLVP